MRKKTRNLYIGIAVIVFIGALLMLSGNEKFKSQVLEESIYDSFAQCVNDSGAKFYGAYWCPACNAQKEMFGSAENNLPYVECSVPNGQQQNITCRRAEIESYPTWEFGDGTRHVGVLGLEELSEVTACQLPVEHTGTNDTMADVQTTDDIPTADGTSTSSDESTMLEDATSTENMSEAEKAVENS